MEKKESLGALSLVESEEKPSESIELDKEGNGGVRIEDFKWGFAVSRDGATAAM